MRGRRGFLKRADHITEAFYLLVGDFDASIVDEGSGRIDLLLSPIERVYVLSGVDARTPNFGPNIDLFISVSILSIPSGRDIVTCIFLRILWMAWPFL